MKTCLPGTLLETGWSSDEPLAVFDAVFAAGGLVLSQVCRLTGLEPHTVQNWVKRGFCSSPVAKQYSKRQFCRLVIINLLKESLPLPRIAAMLTYINRTLTDERDDALGDDELYAYFVRILVKTDRDRLLRRQTEELIHTVAAGYTEAYPGARKRLEKVLQIMVLAYCATRLQADAQLLLNHLD